MELAHDYTVRHELDQTASNAVLNLVPGEFPGELRKLSALLAWGKLEGGKVNSLCMGRLNDYKTGRKSIPKAPADGWCCSLCCFLLELKV